MSKPFTSQYTKEQLQGLYVAWGFPAAVIPVRNNVTEIEFPARAQYRHGHITRSPMKSTYGKPLYIVTLSN